MYKVQVQGSDRRYYDITGSLFSDDNGRTGGVVPMWTFINAPFNLNDGDNINI
jgi:hypothetical protein